LFGCERGLGYDFFFFIYTIVEADDMGDLFFWKHKDGIQRRKSWEEQFESKEAAKWVLYMYSNYTTSFLFQVAAI
jgi:hypothetical protein